MLCKWEQLPEYLQIEEVKPYYDLLSKKRLSLICKRLFDICAAVVMLLILSPCFLVVAIAIKLDSPGPVFYRQVRVTQYGKRFRIFKFRSMVSNADRMGNLVTKSNDNRVTRVGKFIRKYRLDEVCQLIDVLRGTMTFVGTRPEVPRYVEQYTPHMLATLLLPAGITSIASIIYKDEAQLLDDAGDTERVYIDQVLPQKMRYNLRAIKEYSFWGDIKIMWMTLFSVLGKSYVTPEEEEVVI